MFQVTFSAHSVALVVHLQEFPVKYFIPRFVHYIVDLTIVWFTKAKVFYLMILAILFSNSTVSTNELPRTQIVKIARYLPYIWSQKVYELPYLAESVLWADKMGARSKSNGQKRNDKDWVFNNIY